MSMVWRHICGGLFVIALFAGCKQESTYPSALTFWSSSNPEEIRFAEQYIEAWNASHPGIPVRSQPVPEGQSSEEIILAAVVGKTTPDIYANMWQGDVEDYARAGVLVPLDTLDGFPEFLEKRCAPDVIEEITSSDGHIYQVPWKVNPIMMMYNAEIFAEAGMTEPVPDTYGAFLALAEKLTQDQNGDGYMDRWMGMTEVSAIWWQRLFNFVPLYLAASGGAPLVEDERATFENVHAVHVFRFLQEIYRKGYFPKEQMKGKSDPFIGRKIAMRFTGPWAIANVVHFAPDLEYGFHPVPVPDDHTGPVYTYCDPKNIVIFSTCKDPEAAWQFLTTMLTPEADLTFLRISNQFPRRKDLLTHPGFLAFFQDHPEMLPFAEQSRYLRGIDSSPNMKEVLDLISAEYEACVVFGQKTPEEAVRDAAQAVNLLYLK